MKLRSRLTQNNNTPSAFSKSIDCKDTSLEAHLLPFANKDINTEKENNDITETSLIYRRMDSLARLMQGFSPCVSLCLENKVIVIASNNIYGNSKEHNKQTRFIEKIHGYFSTVIKQGINKEKRIELIKKICSAYIAEALKEHTYFFPETYINATIDDIFLRIQKNSVNKEKLEDIKTAPPSIIRIIRDFIKFEKILISKKLLENLEDEELRQDIIHSFRTQKLKIIRNGEKGTHAEIRLIDRNLKGKEGKYKNLSKKDKKPIFIACSKLNCASCAESIDKANAYAQSSFSEDTHYFRTRGTSGLHFGNPKNSTLSYIPNDFDYAPSFKKNQRRKLNPDTLEDSVHYCSDSEASTPATPVKNTVFINVKEEQPLQDSVSSPIPTKLLFSSNEKPSFSSKEEFDQECQKTGLFCVENLPFLEERIQELKEIQKKQLEENKNHRLIKDIFNAGDIIILERNMYSLKDAVFKNDPNKVKVIKKIFETKGPKSKSSLAEKICVYLINEKKDVFMEDVDQRIISLQRYLAQESSERVKS